MPRPEKSVADLMREWRAVAGLTTAQAGERVGLSRRTIEDVEQGRIRVNDELTRAGLKYFLENAK